MNTYLKAFLQIALVIGVGFSTIWLTSVLVRQKNIQTINEVVQQVIVKRPTCPDTSNDFSKLVADGQVITLSDNLNSYGLNGFFINDEVTVVKRTGANSEIACGYLYAEVSVGGKPMQEQWENLYISPAEFGGHIIDSNAILNKSDETKTTLLFDLSKMNYRIGLSRSGEIKTADWASLLNVSNQVSFRIALNTMNPAGKIKTLRLAYRCWNPDSGKETNDCQLSIQ